MDRGRGAQSQATGGGQDTAGRQTAETGRRERRTTDEDGRRMDSGEGLEESGSYVETGFQLRMIHRASQMLSLVSPSRMNSATGMKPQLVRTNVVLGLSLDDELGYRHVATNVGLGLSFSDELGYQHVATMFRE